MNPTRVHDIFWEEFLTERPSMASPTMQHSISGNGGGSGCGSHGQVSLGLSSEQGIGGLLKRKKGSGSLKPSSVKNGIRKQNATSEATANDDNKTVRADVVISAPSHTKQRKLKSNVWKGFERVIQEVREVREVRAICKICKKEFDGSSEKGTTHLNNHLKRCEKGRNRDKGQELISSIESLTATSVVRGNVVFDQERCRLDLARMIIKRRYPLNIAEHEFFKTFSNSFQPTLELPSQENIMAEIRQIYQKGKEEIFIYLDKLSCLFGLAIDFWKDDFKKISYMCFTLRFIDNDWELKEKILAVRKLGYKFDEGALFTTFQSVISSWNIKGKLCSVIVNNICDGIDDDSIYEFMLPYYHKLFRCHVAPISCKSLSKLLVEAGLELIDDILQKIQKSSEYVIATHLRKQMFQAAVNQVKLQDAEVSQDVPTSSNPFLMLEEAMRLRKVFCDLGENDRDFNFNLSTEEWDKAIVIYKCLKAIYDDLSNLAGTKSLTANVYFTRLLHIWKLFPCESEYDYLRLMANTMKSKFIDYWKKGKCKWDCAVALILDPRSKTSFLASSQWQLLYGSRADRPRHKMVIHFIDLYYNYECDPSDPASSASLSSDTLDASPESEFERYLAERTWPSDDKFDILGWWRINTPNFPTLARMARDFLAIRMPNVLSNSALGTEIMRINKAFNDPDPEFVEALICAQDWLETPKSNEQCTKVDDKGQKRTWPKEPEKVTKKQKREQTTESSINDQICDYCLKVDRTDVSLKEEVVSYEELVGCVSDLRTLCPTACLNDTIIDLVCCMFTKCEQEVNQDNRLRLYLPVYFQQKILRGGANVQHIISSYRRPNFWLTRLNNVQQIFIPINDSDKHWYLMVLDFENQRKLMLDSFPSEGNYRTEQIDKIVKFLDKLFVHPSMNFEDRKLPKISTWELSVPTNVPIQQNCYDCGMYVIAFITFMRSNISYTEVKMNPMYRRMLCAYLVKDKNNLIRDSIMKKVLVNDSSKSFDINDREDALLMALRQLSIHL